MKKINFNRALVAKKKLFLFLLSATVLLSACDLLVGNKPETPSSSEEDTPLVIDNGALPGLFSVSSGTKVRFSKAALQYRPGVNKWEFEINQTFFGRYFCWGTGNKPTENSTDDAVYTSFTDWGKQSISNGGNDPERFRTLSSSEWEWLLNKRTNAQKLRGIRSINTVEGLMLLPDNWKQPAGVTWSESKTSYETEEWSKMEKAGAVFLPSGGYFDGSDARINEEGWYWSSTPSGVDGAMALKFNTDTKTVFMTPKPRHFGFFVRLVTEQ